jgi:hypothetical protein
MLRYAITPLMSTIVETCQSVERLTAVYRLFSIGWGILPTLHHDTQLEIAGGLLLLSRLDFTEAKAAQVQRLFAIANR